MVLGDGQSEQGIEKIFSISEYIAILNQKLGVFRAKIIGEVSQVSFGPSGHVYFSLKDEKTGGVISCIIWNSKYRIYGVELKEGAKIIVFGSPQIYAPTGRFSFISETIELAGEGALKKEYDRLKKELDGEGLFAEEKKRKIPEYSRKIGVITSRSGAVLADFLNNLGKFGFKIKMIDSRVEGQTAVADLLGAVKSFRKQDIDVLVIIRGGGSLESMMAFNNEALVREIANFSVPVIAGIGHHKDIPLVALVSDVMVSTPTASANLLSQSWERANLLLEECERSIIGDYEDMLIDTRLLLDKSVRTIQKSAGLIFDKYREIETRLKISFQKFKYALQTIENNLNNSWNKSIITGFKSLILATNQQIEYAKSIVFVNDPERQLQLGYSIARCNGKIIRKVMDIRIGENIDLRIVDGVIISEVKKINKLKK